ncbi:unnamed protein product [Schistosoma curassoni]|nr:unnamed protein product [Schistosoma curassoni]
MMGRGGILIWFLVLTVAILIASYIKPFDHNVKRLKEMMKSNDLKLIDVREPDELEEAGKIPFAVNIPLGEVEDAFKLDEKSFLEKYKIHKPNVADKNVVFSCRSGVRSMRALKIVQDLGYENPLNLVGGYNAWSKENAE